MAIETFTNGDPSTPSPTAGTIVTALFLRALAVIKDIFSTTVNAQEYNGGAFNAATINAAKAAIGSANRTLFLKRGTWVIDANVDLSTTNIHLVLEEGAVLQQSGSTVFLFPQRFKLGKQQHFTGDENFIVFPYGPDYMRPEWFGTPKDDTADDAVGWMKAIRCVQLSSGVTTIRPHGKYYVRQPIVFSRPASGDYRFEVRGAGLRRAWIEVSSTINAASPIGAIFKFDNSGGDVEDLVFERLALFGGSAADNYSTYRCNYGIDCSQDYTPELTCKRVRCTTFKSAGIISRTWEATFEDCTIRNNGGHGIILSLSENNAVNILKCHISANDGIGIWYQGGSTFNVQNCIIEENKQAGLFISAAARGVTVVGNYFEDNGATGLVLDVGAARTIRADVIINGANSTVGGNVVMSTAFPCFAFTAIGNQHNGTVPIEYAYYVPALMSGRISGNFHKAVVGSHLKLVGFYGDSSYSNPSNLVIEGNSGFARLGRISYSTLLGGTFTVGQYVGRLSGGVFTALGKILADNGADTAYVMCQDRKSSTDQFAIGDNLVSATLSGTTFSAGSVTAVATGLSYRPRNVWVDGGVVQNKRQAVSTFRDDEVLSRNFWDTPVDVAAWDPALSVLTIPFTGSTAGSDTIQMDTTDLQTADKIQVKRTDTLSDKGVTHFGTYYAIVVDGSNLKLALTEAAALAGVPVVDITGDIGAGDILPYNGTLKKTGTRFQGNPVYSISRKLKGQTHSGRVRIAIDLDSAEYEPLRGQLVYIGAWVKQSHTTMQPKFTVNSLTSTDDSTYSTELNWKWVEWYGEMPYSGLINFRMSFSAPADAINYELLLTTPIVALVGAPAVSFHRSFLRYPAISTLSGSATTAEVAAKVNEVIAGLQAVDVFG